MILKLKSATDEGFSSYSEMMRVVLESGACDLEANPITVAPSVITRGPYKYVRWKNMNYLSIIIKDAEK